MHVQAEPDGLSLRDRPAARRGRRALVDAAQLPGIGNVFQRVATDVRAEGSELYLRLAFRE